MKVEFPNGPREIEPESWVLEDFRPARPVFDLPGYEVVETIDGKYIAVKTEA